jgi:hypothetical protein
MESLLPLAYIIEREQRALVAQQPRVAEPTSATDPGPVISALRTVIDCLRLKDPSVRYA